MTSCNTLTFFRTCLAPAHAQPKNAQLRLDPLSWLEFPLNQGETHLTLVGSQPSCASSGLGLLAIPGRGLANRERQGLCTKLAQYHHPAAHSAHVRLWWFMRVRKFTFTFPKGSLYMLSEYFPPAPPEKLCVHTSLLNFPPKHVGDQTSSENNLFHFSHRQVKHLGH